MILNRAASRDAQLLLLLGPAVRQRTRERRHGQIGRSAAVGDHLDDARRYERERREKADVALDLFFALRDLLERPNPALGEIVHPGARLGDGGQQRLDRRRIEIRLG
jgi:hypothetical protein